MASSTPELQDFMILGTACQRTVSGTHWQEARASRLQHGPEPLCTAAVPEQEPFRFGPGPKAYSNQCSFIPAGIKGNDWVNPSFTIDGPLPLLGSRSSVKSLGPSIDCETATCDIRLFQLYKVPLYETCAGHLTLRITDFHPNGFPRDADQIVRYEVGLSDSRVRTTPSRRCGPRRSRTDRHHLLPMLSSGAARFLALQRWCRLLRRLLYVMDTFYRALTMADSLELDFPATTVALSTSTSATKPSTTPGYPFRPEGCGHKMPNKVTSLKNHSGSWGRSRECTQYGSRWYLLERAPIEKWARIDPRPQPGVPAPPIPPAMRARWAASSSCSSARSAPSSASHAKSPIGLGRRVSKGPSDPSSNLSEICRDLLEKDNVDKLDKVARNYLLEMADQLYFGSPTEYFYMPNQSDTMDDQAIEISSEEEEGVP